eukprot:9432459-Pyramimonas_sp.AAC.1
MEVLGGNGGRTTDVSAFALTMWRGRGRRLSSHATGPRRLTAHLARWASFIIRRAGHPVKLYCGGLLSGPGVT